MLKSTPLSSHRDNSAKRQSSSSIISTKFLKRNQNLNRNRTRTRKFHLASMSTQSSRPIQSTSDSISNESPSSTPDIPQQSQQKPRFIFNAALPGERIPPEGVVIFEHKVRNWLNIVPPAATATAIGMPALAIGSVAMLGPIPELMTILGAAAFTALLGSFIAFKFTQSHVLMARILQDNTIEFETSGFFGYRRIVQYPANYIYPLTADPQLGHFGYKIKFLPLQQDLDANPGNIQLIDSGLVIAPDCNYLTGHPKACFDALLLGTQTFAQSYNPTTKRRAASFAV